MRGIVQQRQDQARLPQNPFVEISSAARLAVAVYFVFWRMLPTVAALDTQDSASLLGTGAIVLVTICAEALLLLPFLITRFAGIPIGWLHPFILPTVVVLVLELVRRPASLLDPFLVWSGVSPLADHPLLHGWSEAALIGAQLRGSYISLLALFSTYLGFAILRRRQRKATFFCPRISPVGVFFVLAAFLTIIVYFLFMRGGIVSHISSLADGRFRMRVFSGHFLVVNSFLPFLLLLWYAYRETAIRYPGFIIAFFVVALLQFVVEGSRYGLFSAFAMLLAIWMFHNRKVPALRASLIVFVAAVSLGYLGDLRRSGDAGSGDFSRLGPLEISEAWAASQRAMRARKAGTHLAVSALVPEEHDYLYGVTYLAGLAFWIPRSVWPDKPRGAGAHAAALLYKGRETMDGYEGGGYPLNGAAEAYWNFGFPGVVLVFGAFGGLLNLVAGWVCRQPANAFAVVTLLIMDFTLTTPNTNSIVTALQSLTLLLFVAVINRLVIGSTGRQSSVAAT
jgi:hypothetical protein